MVLRVRRHPVGHLVQREHRRLRDLATTLGRRVRAGLRLEHAEQRAGGVAHAGDRVPGGRGQPVAEPGLGQPDEHGRQRLAGRVEVGRRDPAVPTREPGRVLDGGDGQLGGRLRRHPVGQLVRLVDDDHLVLGQHAGRARGGDAEHRVVGDDDVGLPRRGLRLLGEALGEHRALAAEALQRGDGDLPPGPVGDAGHEVVAVPGVGLVGPLPQAQDLLAEALGQRGRARCAPGRGARPRRRGPPGRTACPCRRRGTRRRPCARTRSCASP